MIKTDLQLLEENRDQARSMVLAISGQISLMEDKTAIIVDPSKEKERMMRLQMLEKMKAERRGHEMMVTKFDKMIEEEKKHAPVRGSDK